MSASWKDEAVAALSEFVDPSEIEVGACVYSGTWVVYLYDGPAIVRRYAGGAAVMQDNAEPGQVLAVVRALDAAAKAYQAAMCVEVDA